MTNEQIPRLRELTSKVNPEICGAIASGGEVPLAVMLLQPNIQECVAIDQSYNSLRWAYLKAMVIHLCTPDEAHKVLTTPVDYNKDNNWPSELVAKIRSLTPANLAPTAYRSGGYDLWAKYTTVTDIGRIKANLDKLHLIHGDIRDLPQFTSRKCDIVYLSNATEKSNYLSNTLSLSDFNNVVRPSGYILTTGGEQDKEENWKERQKLPHLNGHPNASWSYRLLQFKGAEYRTYARQAWERIRDMRTFPTVRPDGTKQVRMHCMSMYCKTIRDWTVYTTGPGNAYCNRCGTRVDYIPPPPKIVRLHDRYVKA